MRNEYRLSALCRALGVSRSGFHDWLHRKEEQVPDHLPLRARIRRIFLSHRSSYGHRSIRAELRKEGIHVGRKLVLRLMKAEGLTPSTHRPRPYRKGEAGEHKVAKNRLDRKFEVSRENRVWTSDITYIWTARGWVYLAVILDLFSRRVIAWELSETPDTGLVLRALYRAVRLRKPRRWRLMFHSDQGCQYTARALRQALRDLGILQSMSRRGQCWDNAPTESFFGTLKQETGIAKWILEDGEAVGIALSDWIDSWYNPLRRHTSLGGCSPAEYEINQAA